MTLLNRLGLLPALLIGLLLVLIGSTFVMSMINNSWLVDPNSPAFVELQRRAASGTIDSNILYQNSEGTLITAFLGSMVVIGMGLALPIAFLLNRRIRAIGAWGPASYSVLMRQGVWAGIWFAICMWLQMSRTLSIPIALLLLAIFMLFEAFIMIRQRSAETAQT